MSAYNKLPINARKRNMNKTARLNSIDYFNDLLAPVPSFTIFPLYFTFISLLA